MPRTAVNPELRKNSGNLNRIMPALGKSEMNILVNNISETLPAGHTLSDLLMLHELREKQGMAIALNNTVVPRAEWERQELFENDKVTILLATQGG